MTAAIYARKSNEQNNRDEADKSVQHQVRRAREYAVQKGWLIDESSIFVDDGISGAEFDKRAGLVRLLRSLETKPRPSFDVLLVADESRLGRETIETSFVLKQIIQAGVRVYFYRDDRERTLDTPMDRFMLSATTFADDLKRVKDGQAVYDKVSEKARQGFVVGAIVFGYDNVAILGPTGKRSHVERRVNEAQAEVIRRIFELSAKGTGYSRTAKLLNSENAPSPRPKMGRKPGWSPSTIKEILQQRLYLGEVIWGRTKKRDSWGRTKPSPRPESEWIRVKNDSLRILTEAEWAAAHDRLDAVRAQLRSTGAASGNRRSRDIESPYLLSGFARCGSCGGAIGVVGGSKKTDRRHVYACLARHKRGTCANALRIPLQQMDLAVLETIAGDVLRPNVVSAVLQRVFALLESESAPGSGNREATEKAIREAEVRVKNLTHAIESGGEDLNSLLIALRKAEQTRTELQKRLTASQASVLKQIDRHAVAEQVNERLGDWRQLLTSRPAHGRQLLREALQGLITFTPGSDGAYRFSGSATFLGLFTGDAGGSTLMVAIRGFEPRFCG